MFNEAELDARIDAANERYVTGDEIPNAPPNPNSKPVEKRKIGTGEEVWEPVDIYQRDATRQYEESKKSYPRGSSSLVKAVTESIINGNGPADGLARARKRAEDDSESLRAQGYKDRAELVKQQYMQENFLPAVEAVINYASPDELLNCREALSALDKMAIGVGSMRGYTASYVRQAYGNALGRKEGDSDPTVTEMMRRIKSLVRDDQYRTAIGMAKKLKKQIDDGQHIASDEDYDVIGRMVAYAG